MAEFIKGVNYPKELTENRLTTEGNVIALIYTDLSHIPQYNLQSNNFITEDGRFYYNIAERMMKARYTSIKQIDILTVPDAIISDEMKQLFEDKGGYTSIENMIDCINIDNTEKYIDDLKKANTITKLYDNGYNLIKPITIDKDTNTIPISLFKDFSNADVIDFYENQLYSMIEDTTKETIVNEALTIDADTYIQDIKSGIKAGISFGYSGRDVNNNKIKCLPKISEAVGGFVKGTLNMIGGYSSTGKTTLFVNILISLITQGLKVLIISNEQTEDVFKNNIIAWIICNVYKSPISKSILIGNETMTAPCENSIRQAVTYFQEHFQDKIFFVQIRSANMREVEKHIKIYSNAHGIDVFLYDTFKLDMAKSTYIANTSYLQLIEDSRKLDELSKKYNLIGLASVQLSESTKGELFLDASTLSQSKQIKEVLEVLILMRNAYSDELKESQDNKNKRFFARPYNDIVENGTNKKVEYTPLDNASYKMIFIEKARNGRNSGDTGIAYLLRFNGSTGEFHEVAKCKPAHTNIKK